MNKRLGRLVAFSLMLCLSASLAHAAEPSSIYEIYTSSPTRWQGEYQTVRNETVSVDCAVRVPDAEKAPVLRVHWYPSINQAFKDEFDSLSWADLTTTVVVLNWTALIPYNLQPKDYQYVQTFIPLDQVDWDKAYCENNDLTPRDALTALQDALQHVFQTYGTEGFYPLQPSYGITVVQLKDNEGNSLWDKGIYELTAYEVLRDIPLLGIMRDNYRQQNAYAYEALYSPGYYTLQIEAKDSFSTGANLVSEEEVLHEDIPLVGFETVKPQIEQLIIDGKMREVYQVQLGYIVFLEPDHNLRHFVLVPAWVVDCDYFYSAKDEPEYVDSIEEASYEYKYRHRKIVFSAQTGMVIDPDNMARNRCNAPQIITWDDVK